MKILKNTFKYYLASAKEALQKAGKEKNPAKWLYQNNFRTTLFMLEALTRVYEEISDKKLFNKLNSHFKTGEDMIGEIDYFYYYAEELEDNKVKQNLIKKAEEKENEYNQILIEKGWLDGKRLKKIKKKLSEIKKVNKNEEIKKIRDFYKNEIEKINSFSNSEDFKFTDIEDDVHEMRRKLRWLSIYPQAFLGLFKYAEKQEKAPAHVQKYLTDKIINSKYNVFPTTLSFKTHILIDKDYFMALSWIIDAVGDLKDEGLKSEALELINHSSSDKNKISLLLKESEKILRPFFKEKNLENLLYKD